MSKFFLKHILMKSTLIALFALFFLAEIYVYQAVKTITQNNYIKVGYGVFTLAAYCIILFWIITFNRAARDHHQIQILVSALMVFVFPKLMAVLFLLIGDVYRLISFGIQSFGNTTPYFPERRKFISLIALSAAGVFSAFAIDGIIFGKYRHTVRKIKLNFKNLPQAFKGYRIVQISDVHSGSFFHPEKLKHAIDIINKQNPDLVLFTGDMVNNYADEFKPFISLFEKIQSKNGKFSVLGNHDYGGYGAWSSEEEKTQNVPKLIEYQKQAGFRMLRNESIAIEKNGEKIYILGVENWGIPPFPQYGDLDLALEGIPDDAIKILMSHDPTHFDEVVKNHKTDIQLTISGHTHGMQFGLDLKNIKWSPVKFKYKKWVDLYKANNKYLYVNRGFGVIAYPGRVGIKPEITVIELS